jgi:hypothetical protein
MELSKFFKKDPKKAAKDLPKRLAASLNKIPIRKGGQDPIEGEKNSAKHQWTTNYCRGDYKSGGCQMQSFSKRLAASLK